jgi:putative transcriptional regulator
MIDYDNTQERYDMAKVVSKVRQLRMNRSAELGRPVSIEEVATATGIARPTLSRIELNQTERIDFDTIKKLCAYFGVGVGEVLEFRPEDILSPALLAA